MKFIFADSMDYIDPNYDFLTDSSATNRSPYWDDMFPHEYMETPPYDGILVSRAVVGDHLYKGKYTEAQGLRFRLQGVRKFLRYDAKRFPDSMVFGDCGAFQYHKMEVPPYTPEDMLEFYDDGGFTHGCSVDHIIFDFNPQYDDGLSVPEELKQRREITLEYAASFLRAAKPMLPHFKPVGVVQAWSPTSMAQTSQELVKMGYDYIALGGLVPVNVEGIHLVVQSVREVIPKNIKIHILGFAKANYLHEFTKYCISSFDTTSPFIRAFKDARQNYWLLKNGHVLFYAAIKIPQVYANNKLKNLIRMGVYEQEDVLSMEQHALNQLRSYAVGETSLDDVIEAVLNYTRVTLYENEKKGESIDKKLKNLEKLYRSTLEDRPWEMCNCRVCREAGIEVVIFRSSNRNKRRGIHNLHIFNNYLKGVLSRA